MVEWWRWVPVALSLPGCAAEALSADASTVTTTSTSGLLMVTASTLDAQPPERGANSFEIEITRIEDGAAQEGLELAVTPWMPAMGHGTSARPVVEDLGGGHYLAEGVYLFMPGLWELRMSLSGPLRDDAKPSFQIR